MYTSLHLNTWKTSLFECNCESCFVSYIAPCHVYAKLRNGNYAYHCFVYTMILGCIQILHYWLYYINKNVCPSNKVDYCINLDETTCNQSYMMVNNIPSACTFHKDANLCTYDTYECITYHTYHHTQMFLFMFSLFTYLSLWMLHFKLRNQIKESNKIYDDHFNCLANTCCSTCGLAQEYREIIL
jgi:hypothetical protein